MIMKFPYPMVMVVALLGFAFFGCDTSQEAADTSFTGNEITYTLYQASDYPVSGVVTLKERTDGTTQAELTLTGTEGNVWHPVHLHFGAVEDDGNIALLLSPVLGKTGKSSTHIAELADGTEMTYQDMVGMDASVKIHLSDTGADYFVILAGGDIGAAFEKSKGTVAGRLYINVCK
jgi:hypothetical protein